MSVFGSALLLSSVACSVFTRTPALPDAPVEPEANPLPETQLTATDARVGSMGRAIRSADGRLEFSYPGVTVRVCFKGTGLWVTGSSNQGRSHLAVVHQGDAVGELVMPRVESEVLVWQGANGELTERCLDLVHRTETWLGVVTLSSFRVLGEVTPATPFPERRLLFVGDSVTCGEAVRRKPECSKDETWWDAFESYGALAARSLGAQYQLVCFGGKGMLRDWEGRSDVLNGPDFFPLVIPDERRLPYDLSSYVPDGIVVSLGTNDFNAALGAFPNEREFVGRYVAFVQELRRTYPQARIWLTEGALVTDALEGATLNAKQKTTLRAFLHQVVASSDSGLVRQLATRHQPGDTCDAHPTASQHQAMAQEVVVAVREQLGW